nr:hypothetical protein [uncultured Sphingomonas sp.]
MTRVIRIAAVLSAFILLLGCDGWIGSEWKLSGKIYVLVPAHHSFTPELAAMLRGYGMVTHSGSATDDAGNTLNVLDAKIPSIHLRSENVHLSGQEDPRECGLHAEPYPDPGQYFVSVSIPDKNSNKERAQGLLDRLSMDLVQRGYEVRQEPRICSKSGS